MLIRHATLRDLLRLRQIYDSAKQYMRANGNPTQWGTNRPSRTLIEEDIRLGRGYVVEEDGHIGGAFELLISDLKKEQLYVMEETGEVHAVFVLAEGPDSTYAKIDGAWLSDMDYMVIHRIASDGKSRGILSEALRFGFGKTPSIRIDTHSNNHIMQTLLKQYGFTYCGIIYLENGDPRLAYQADR